LDAIADADADLRPRVVDPEVLRSTHDRALVPARQGEERDVRGWINLHGLGGDLADVDDRGMEAQTPALRREIDQVRLDPSPVLGGRRTDPHRGAVTQDAVDGRDRSRRGTHRDILRRALRGAGGSARERLGARTE
jgi:hypothetical protein